MNIPSESEKSSKNNEFFEILKSLIIIFEFDKTYPEARKTLMSKRSEQNKNNKMAMAGQNLIKGACTCI